jgi:lipopolysaccharide export system protein LptA
LTAEKLVQNKKSKSVTAEGNITFKSVSKDNEPVEGRSEKARYDTDQGQAELWEGRPEIIYHVKDSTRPVQLTADLIRFDEKKEEIFASGEVVVVSSSANAHSPEALFEQKERKVTLTGTAPQPELVYTNEDQPGKYRADKITLFVDRKKAFLEGNVRTRVTVKELDQKK